MTFLLALLTVGASCAQRSSPSGTAKEGDSFEVRVVGARYRWVGCQLSQFNMVYSASGWAVTALVSNPTDTKLTAEIPRLQIADLEGRKHSVPEDFWSTSACANRGVDEKSGRFLVFGSGFSLEYQGGRLESIFDGKDNRGKAFLELSPHGSVKLLLVFEGPAEFKPKTLLWPNKQPIAIPME
ncbi:MAG: hypothetical protein ABSH46_05945 [Bryobacteraceae bacterium]